MPITVMIDFPTSVEKNRELLAARPELMDPIIDLISKNGLISHSRLVGDGRFIDIDVFESRAHYAAFKAAALQHIDAYEAALGVRSVDSVWDQDLSD